MVELWKCPPAPLLPLRRLFPLSSVSAPAITPTVATIMDSTVSPEDLVPGAGRFQEGTSAVATPAGALVSDLEVVPIA